MKFLIAILVLSSSLAFADEAASEAAGGQVKENVQERIEARKENREERKEARQENREERKEMRKEKRAEMKEARQARRKSRKQ
jgi:hypothetical protein